MAEHFEL